MQKIIFGLVALLLVISNVNAQEASPEIRMAAKVGLPRFLKVIPPGKKSDYGFSENDVIDQAYLGDPFNLYIIKPPAILGYQPGHPVQELLSQTNTWYFPVMLHDEVRAILEVNKKDGKWQAVGFGYVNIANKLRGVMRRWPRSKGFHPCLIAILQAKEHFIMVPEENAEKLISLSPQNPDLEMEDAMNIIERVKPIVQDAIRQSTIESEFIDRLQNK